MGVIVGVEPAASALGRHKRKAITSKQNNDKLSMFLYFVQQIATLQVTSDSRPLKLLSRIQSLNLLLVHLKTTGNDPPLAEGTSRQPRLQLDVHGFITSAILNENCIDFAGTWFATT